MASSNSNKTAVSRASAVLTTGEVAGAPFDLNRAWGSQVSVEVDFDKGSLTSADIRHYVSSDKTNWFLVGAAKNLTADATYAETLGSLAGWKWIRTSVQGTGTVTGSAAKVTYRYLSKGSQS